MFTPDGQPADGIDKIMLLTMWANALKKNAHLMDCNEKKIISAGMGKPTFPINHRTVQSHLNYWKEIDTLIKRNYDSNEVCFEEAAIDYGDPRGDYASRKTMAVSMSTWYGVTIEPSNLLFTVGGVGALRIVFETFNSIYKDTSNYRVITPFPHYTFYASNHHQLHPIDVMQECGYQLTAQNLQSSIISAYALAEKDNGYPKMILLCNPNSPLGTILNEKELIRIIEVLRQYPDLHIVLDEAYAEMCFTSKKVPSFIEIAPDLKNRLIIIRSATKAFSAAGERMAVIIAFDKLLMSKLLAKNIGTIGHAPRSSQIAYAETMAHFTDEQHQQLRDFYHQKIVYVTKRLKHMGADMPDPDYQVEATFYILADLSDLFGLELPMAAEQALQKTGCVTTGEDLAYYLLFNDGVMIAPLCYFGLPNDNGFMRITCSGNEAELCELMDRLEVRLFEARQDKKKLLLSNIVHCLPQFQKINEIKHDEIIESLADIHGTVENALSLREQNFRLKKIYASLNNWIHQARKIEALAPTTVEQE